MDSFVTIISAWPSRRDLAADLAVDEGLVKQWQRRDSIPARYWHRLVEAASERQISGIDEQVLTRLAARADDGSSPGRNRPAEPAAATRLAAGTKAS